MSAVTEHQDAQSAAMSAKENLSSLNARIASGDATVTGSDLATAEGDVSVADRLEAGALTRMQDELAAAEEAAKFQAIEALMTGYRSTSSGLSDAIDKALTALSELLAAAGKHEASTQVGLGAARLEPRMGVPGHGLLQIPSINEVIEGTIELAIKKFGMRPVSPYPEGKIRPIMPFLTTGALG